MRKTSVRWKIEKYAIKKPEKSKVFGNRKSDKSGKKYI